MHSEKCKNVVKNYLLKFLYPLLKFMYCFFLLYILLFYTEAKTASSVNVDTSWALGIIAGIIGTLAIVVIIAVLARKRHHQPLQYEGKMVSFFIT